MLQVNDGTTHGQYMTKTPHSDPLLDTAALADRHFGFSGESHISAVGANEKLRAQLASELSKDYGMAALVGLSSIPLAGLVAGAGTGLVEYTAGIAAMCIPFHFIGGRGKNGRSA
jgi:hypothetical protein